MRSDNMPRPFAPEYEAQDVLVRLRSFPSTPAEPELAKEAADEIERLREDVSQLRDLLADLELTREGSKVAHAELKELKKDKAWRFEVCERLGMSCAAGKEWSTDELWWHVQWLEELARRPAESELSALRAKIEAAEVYTVSKMPGSAFGLIVLSPELVGKRARLVVEEG